MNAETNTVHSLQRRINKVTFLFIYRVIVVWSTDQTHTANAHAKRSNDVTAEWKTRQYSAKDNRKWRRKKKQCVIRNVWNKQIC